MDVRDTPEQAELRRTARQLSRELGPRAVNDLSDAMRSKRLARAVQEAGWLELRHEGDEGAPLASGVEAAIIADALAGAVADVAFAGPVLAADLARRAGVSASDGAVVAFSPDLFDAGVVSGPATPSPLYAIDCAADSLGSGYVVVPERDGYRLAQVQIDAESESADLTRAIRKVPAQTPVLEVREQRRVLTRDDLDSWVDLGLAITSADLVGVM